MAIAGPMYRLSWGGSLFGLDQWTNSVYVHGGGAAMPTVPAAYLAAIQGLHTNNMVDAKLEFIKFNEINPLTGRYANLTISNTHVLAPAVAGLNTSSWPQLTRCATLGTIKARGRGSKGRIFPPNGVGAPDGSGRIPTTTITAMNAQVRDFINAVNAVVANSKVVVFSKLAQEITPVTYVAHGRVMDTQRRRRANLLEEPVRLSLA